MRKKWVLLQVLAVLIAVFQYGTRPAEQDKGGQSDRILSSIFHPYLIARIPLAGSSINHWLVITGRISRARIRAHRRLDRRYRKMSLRMVLSQLIGMLHTCGNRTARAVWCYCSDVVYLYQLTVKSVLFYTLMECGGLVNEMLLMLSGDIESNPGPETQLKHEDLGSLKRLLQPVSAYWVPIADQLGMTSQVAIIQSAPANTGPPAFLRDLLYRWLTRDRPTPTLEALCQALRDDEEIIGGARVAKKLEEKFQRQPAGSNRVEVKDQQIASQSPRRPPLIQMLVHRHPQVESELSNMKRYCARMYYCSIGIHSWEVYFAIMWNLEIHIAAINAWYAEANAIMGPYQEVMFKEEKITLDIPMEGIVLENGWIITPHTYPRITKRQVDRFVPGRLVPSCQLHVMWAGQQEQPVQLLHTVELLGAEEPSNFFLIQLPSTPPPLTPQSGVTGSAPSKPQLKDLMDALYHKVADRWKMIGVYLEFSREKLEGISEKCRGDPQRCLLEMLETWSKRIHPPASWAAIIEAMGFLGEEQLERELKDKYMQATTSPTPPVTIQLPQTSSGEDHPFDTPRDIEISDTSHSSHPMPVQDTIGYLLAGSADPNVQGLARHLPQRILQSKVDSNSQGHVHQLAKWKQWADTNAGMDVFPVEPSHLCQYLTHLVDTDGHEAALADISKSMVWVHSLAGYISPVTDPRVGTLLTQLQEILHQLEICDHLMRDKETLEFTLMQCMFIGLPQAGKSSLMRRLMGEQPLIHSSSTGVVDEAKKVIVTPVIEIDTENAEYATVQVSGMVWEKLMFDEEAVMFLQDMVRTFHSLNPTPESGSSIPKEQETESQHDNDAVEERSESNDTVITQTHHDQNYAPMDPFKEALKNKKWDIAKQKLEDSWTLYLTDTGGQPEFQEVLPALISGPTVFVIVFNLLTGLNEKFEVKYVRQSGVSSKPYTSAFTLQQAILKMLAGIACTAQHVGNAKSKVLLVGTHKDQVTQEEIKEVEEQLQCMLKGTAFFKEGLIEYANRDERKMLFAVNNLSQNSAETAEIRAAIQRIGGKQKGKRYSFKVKIPATWLAFYLTLRNLQRRVLSYEECIPIGRKCGIETRHEVDDALFFLHTRLGVIRHFQVDGLRDVVITDPQLIFNKITELILETFTLEDVPNQDRFEREGFFQAGFIEVISRDEDSELFTSSMLVQLLQHLNIIAPVENPKGELEYFMPCVLRQVDPQQESIASGSSVAPLVFKFNCGYCPMGLFSALAAYLTQNKMNSSYDWKLRQNFVFKNHCEFKVGPYNDVVALTAKDTHFVVSVTQAYKGQRDRSCKLDVLCCEVRACIEKGISEASATMHYKCNATYRLGFYCNCAPTYPQDHITIIQDEKRGVLECLEADAPCQVLSTHRMWLSQLDEGDGTVSCDLQVPLPQATGAVPEPTLKELVKVKATSWYNLGLELDVEDDDLQTIKRNNPQDQDGCKRDTFRTWLKICPHASYRQLVEALVEVGDGSEADRLCQKLGIDMPQS